MLVMYIIFFRREITSNQELQRTHGENQVAACLIAAPNSENRNANSEQKMEWDNVNLEER